MAARRLVPEGCPLTPRQFEVLSLVAEGLTRVEIAERLFVAPTTVRTHIWAGLRRLGARSEPHAVQLMGRAGWAGWRPPPPEPEPPVAGSEPFLAAYLRELDVWLASGCRDARARRGMLFALAGARNLMHIPA